MQDDEVQGEGTARLLLALDGLNQRYRVDIVLMASAGLANASIVWTSSNGKFAKQIGFIHSNSVKIRVLSFGVIALCVRDVKIYFLFARSVSHWGVLPRPDHVSPFGPLYLGSKAAGFFSGVVAAFDGVTSLMMIPFMWERSYIRLAF